MKLILALMAALVTAVLAGCVVVAHPYHRGVAVVIPHGHVHSATCGHYFYRGRWYHWHGHVHGPGCGHVFKGGIWIIAD